MAKPTNTGAAATALRLSGAQPGEIAQALGLADEGEVQSLIERHLAAVAVDDRAGRNQLRDLYRARIERLLRGVWAKATDPNNPEHLEAVGKAMGLIDRGVRLDGVAVPAEVIVYNPTQAELDAWVDSMLSKQSGYMTLDDEPDVIEGELMEPKELES